MTWFEMPKDANQGDYSVVSPQDVAAKIERYGLEYGWSTGLES
jgi:hypothetical protein